MALWRGRVLFPRILCIPRRSYYMREDDKPPPKPTTRLPSIFSFFQRNWKRVMVERIATTQRSTWGLGKMRDNVEHELGKVYVVKEELIPIGQASLFPSLHVRRIRDLSDVDLVEELRHQDKVTMILMTGCTMTSKWYDTWFRECVVPFLEHPRFRVLEVSLVDNPFLQRFPGLVVNTLRTSLPSQRLDHHFICFRDIEELRTALNQMNRFTCYVYLVDRKGRRRWNGSGKPTEEELTFVQLALRNLLGGWTRK